MNAHRRLRRVLAIDQIADERSDKPAVVKAVTLEVDTVGAQKISLAASIGTLSLSLRKAGEADSSYTRRITISDLTTSSAPIAVERKGANTAATVEVVRGTQRQEYSVPTEGKNLITEDNSLRAAEVGEPLAVGN